MEDTPQSQGLNQPVANSSNPKGKEDIVTKTLYFTTLPPELLIDIGKRLDHHQISQHALTLGYFSCHSFSHLKLHILGGTKPSLAAFYSQSDVEMNLDSVQGRPQVFVRTYGHNFVLNSPMLLESLRRIRRLSISLRLRHVQSVSYDAMFGALANLEELSLSVCHDFRDSDVMTSLSDSIARHLHSVHTLFLPNTYTISGATPLFRAIGHKIRTLKIPQGCGSALVSMAQYCTVLEEVHVADLQLQFLLRCKASLRVVHFSSSLDDRNNFCLSKLDLQELISLFENLPDVVVHLPFLRYNANEAQELFDRFGHRIRTLFVEDFSVNPSISSKTFEKLVNLERLSLCFEHFDELEESENLLREALSIPKPNLRELKISGTGNTRILDCISRSDSSLQEFSYDFQYYGGFDDHLDMFLSANERLKRLCITYNRSEGDTSNSLRQHAIGLILNLKNFSSLRQLELNDNEFSPSDLIAVSDACVGLRRRGFSVLVNGTQYLK